MCSLNWFLKRCWVADVFTHAYFKFSHPPWSRFEPPFQPIRSHSSHILIMSLLSPESHVLDCNKATISYSQSTSTFHSVFQLVFGCMMGIFLPTFESRLLFVRLPCRSHSPGYLFRIGFMSGCAGPKKRHICFREGSVCSLAYLFYTLAAHGLLVRLCAL